MKTPARYRYYITPVLLWLSLTGLSLSEDLLDVISGTDVILKCRFDPGLHLRRATLYWIRSNRRNHDNVAIGDTAFHQDYRVEARPAEGRYDLHISHANYERDNGKFECRVKEDGTGVELYTATISLTVLLPPGQPSITRSSLEAVEGQPYSLSCSSAGGSPPPDISWLRLSDGAQLTGNTSLADHKDGHTVSVLELIPSKQEDGAIFRCDVTNRAISAQSALTTDINISVNYFPVVTVGPANPYRVEVEQTAEMVCRVDSKPRTEGVKWEFAGSFIDTNFRHVIPSVSLQDAGSYYCSADNGLGQVDKEELILDVQYGPQLVVSGPTDVDLGSSVTINCQVSANPRPLAVQWLRKDHPEFVQPGQTLHISEARAEDSGEYVCNSYNLIHPAGSHRQRRDKNATVAVNVRHKPGQASILPEEAIAVAGRAVTLVCQAEPPGYPEPTYRWWQEGSDSTILAVSSHYTIDQVETGSAGRYFCQPHNSLGHVQPASVDLQVYQAPRLTSKPTPRMVKKTGDNNLKISCSSIAKPKPKVRWFKDGVEIISGVSTKFQVSTNDHGQNVLSTLSFVGSERENTDKLDYRDKGHYSCQFSNQVGRSESTTVLVMEHAPLPAHRYSRVAYDLGQQGQIVCRMRAFPEPRFDWTYGDDVLELDVVNYYSNVTQLDQDLYESVLTVTKVRESSYGEYTCRALNTMGAVRTKIFLQKKGPPSRPLALTAAEVGADHAMLEWSPGFDGGHADTEYLVEYRREEGDRVEQGVCQSGVACNLTHLLQHSTYTVRVKATNLGGESDWSDEMVITTLVDLLNIPRPDSLVVERSTRLAHIQAPSTQLVLVAELEVRADDGAWRKFGEKSLGDQNYGKIAVSGVQEEYSQLPVTEEGGETGPDLALRARLCLEEDPQACGPYITARVVDQLELGQSWLIALIVIVTLLGLIALLIAIKCVCQTRKNTAKSGAPGVGGSLAGRHTTNIDSYKAQMFAIAGDNQHGLSGGLRLHSGFDLNSQMEQSSANSGTDSANSQEPLWAYQRSDSHYPAAALQGYDNSVGQLGQLGPPHHYPFIDDTPTSEPDKNYFSYSSDHTGRHSRPISGQYNCNTGMGESQYSYQGLPDPSAYFSGAPGAVSPNIFLCDNNTDSGLATPNTRARRVVHEVIV